MSVPALAALLLCGAVALAWVARRERQAIRVGRSGMLDAVTPLFDKVFLSRGDDGFPSLTGTIGEHCLRLELIPDTLTLRRLPQLWLRLTLLEPLPVSAGFGVLARPSGAEDYALTPRFQQRLAPPGALPAETLARGGNAGAGLALRAAAPAIAALLKDRRIKEVAATPKGLRVIFQLAEGRRGPHLLLRQCDFVGASLAPADLLRLHDGLIAMAAALGGPRVLSRDGAPLARSGGAP
jgi:hypothetical protein